MRLHMDKGVLVCTGAVSLKTPHRVNDRNHLTHGHASLKQAWTKIVTTAWYIAK
jgi:hypothetical protein